MGQRVQILVQIPNPVKHLYFKDKAEKQKAIEVLGNGKTTILSFHNQWLFGRGALQQCLSLLQFANNFTKKDLLGNHSSLYDVPFSVTGFNNYNTIEKITKAIAFIMNFRPNNTEWLSAGVGASFYIGTDEYDIELREDFTRGDNNDGVIIVDMINKKYCFTNPYSKSREKKYDVRNLPMCKPFDAHSYVKCYYGETIKTIKPYHLENKTKEQQLELVKYNIKVNGELANQFKGFKVLTLEELDMMFPKMNLIKNGKEIVVSLK
jgi:hypothetical protein